MKSYFLAFIFFPFFTFAGSSEPNRIPLNLEFAVKKEEKEWGLMGRRELLDNHGMLFIFPKEEQLTFWMFNSFIDLTVAFINRHGVIQEICALKSFPNLMDPTRQVNSLDDMKKYPLGDKTLVFFYSRRVVSRQKASMALEMKGGWFEDNKVQIGDRLIWQADSPYAEILRM